LPRGFAKLIRQYAMQIGLATWAWNSLHANLFLIFWFFMGDAHHPENRARAQGIWHATKNVSVQRQMLLRAIESEFVGWKRKELDKNKQQLLHRIVWLIHKADILSRYRNIAAHVPAVFSPLMTQVPLADPTSTREQMLHRFNQINHRRFWRVFAGDVNALSKYALRLAFEIYQPGVHGPLPHRPRLLSPPQMKVIDDRINRQAMIEARSSPQSSSRGKYKFRRPRSPA
jgi:hypothetical protein